MTDCQSVLPSAIVSFAVSARQASAARFAPQHVTTVMLPASGVDAQASMLQPSPPSGSRTARATSFTGGKMVTRTCWSNSPSAVPPFLDAVSVAPLPTSRAGKDCAMVPSLTGYTMAIQVQIKHVRNRRTETLWFEHRDPHRAAISSQRRDQRPPRFRVAPGFIRFDATGVYTTPRLHQRNLARRETSAEKTRSRP